MKEFVEIKLREIGDSDQGCLKSNMVEIALTLSPVTPYLRTQ